MSRTRGVFLAFLGCAAVLVFSPTAQAQIGSTMRGTVVDINGQPIPEVKAEFIFKGETRVPIVKVATTDKKGQYVRVGLKSGNWEVTFTKAGFKPRTINTWFSGDALSETPPVTMPPAAAGEKAVTSAAEAAAQAKEAENMKQLGATYKLALDAMNAADYAKAETLFKEVLLANPSVASAHHNLGYVYMQQNKADAAEESYRKAIEVDPNKSDSYIALAALLAAKGKVAEGFDLLNGVAALFGAGRQVPVTCTALRPATTAARRRRLWPPSPRLRSSTRPTSSASTTSGPWPSTETTFPRQRLSREVHSGSRTDLREPSVGPGPSRHTYEVQEEEVAAPRAACDGRGPRPFSGVVSLPPRIAEPRLSPKRRAPGPDRLSCPRPTSSRAPGWRRARRAPCWSR